MTWDFTASVIFFVSTLLLAIAGSISFAVKVGVLR